jgi:hypothetical protein
MTGPLFVVSALYLSLVVAAMYTLLERDFGPLFWRHTGRRWGKFLLLLVGLAIVVQVLDWVG